MIQLPSLSAEPAKMSESAAEQHMGCSNGGHNMPLSDPSVQEKVSTDNEADASKRSQPREVKSELPHGGTMVCVALPPGSRCTAVLQY